MSRRAKLLLLGILLVLLAVIPIIWLYVTWHPAHPLRCRVIQVEDVPGDYWGKAYLVEVQNTTSATVNIGEMAIGRRGTTESVHEAFFMGTPTAKIVPPVRMGPDRFVGAAIPAHHTQHLVLYLAEREGNVLDTGDFDAHYAWHSGTQRRFSRLIRRLRGPGFDSWIYQLKDERDSSPLDFSPVRPVP